MRNLAEMDEFIRHTEAMNIVNQVKLLSTEFYHSRVSTRKPFGLATDVVPLLEGDILLRYNKGIGPYESALVKKGEEDINKWNVIISYLTAEHAGQTDKEGRKRIISSLDILKPKEICTETYLVVDSFDSEIEAVNLNKYLKTRLVRFLIAQLAATQHLSKDKFALVPLQDFTRNKIGSEVMRMKRKMVLSFLCGLVLPLLASAIFGRMTTVREPEDVESDSLTATEPASRSEEHTSELQSRI